MMINIAGIWKSPLTAMISPKSVFVSFTTKLFTVSVKPEVKAIKHPSPKINLRFLCSALLSSSVKEVSSTKTKRLNA